MPGRVLYDGTAELDALGALAGQGQHRQGVGPPGLGGPQAVEPVALGSHNPLDLLFEPRVQIERADEDSDPHV